MILKGLKEKSNKKLINKLQNQRLVTVNKRKIETVALLYVIENKNDISALKQVVLKLNKQFKKVFPLVLDLRKKPELGIEGVTYNSKAIGWSGKIKLETLSEYLKKDYDLLINYYKKDIIALHVINAKINALIKVGLYQTENELNDLIIDADTQKVDVFINEMLKYLKILNTK